MASKTVFYLQNHSPSLVFQMRFFYRIWETREGREQAALLGKRLAQCGISFDELVMSTMIRARETAEIILEHLPPALKRLQLFSDVSIRPLLSSSSSCPLLEEGPPYPPVPAVDYWNPEYADFFAEGLRIESAFRRHIHRADSSQKEDSYELYVCHSNVIRYFVCRALQFPPEGWLRMSLGNCSITWLVIFPSGRVSLQSLGDIGHLPFSKVTFTLV
ncbi:unnamed protein product [Cylicostephanus goldi]|uniref:Serine/threonine-protein phosphatase PGAM5, mitochondrial n=1 Tax=Cylicostephanus goldi TaxID=71465 RepID=A0A3P6SQM5_CYLGO|nr:unnamed protein product [Cylicostephanus goldi]